MGNFLGVGEGLIFWVDLKVTMEKIPFLTVTLFIANSRVPVPKELLSQSGLASPPPFSQVSQKPDLVVL